MPRSVQSASTILPILALPGAYGGLEPLPLRQRGVRRNGTLIAGDIQQHIDTIRTIAQQEGLSETCLDRIEKAERVGPTRRATIAFVSGYVRQQVRQ